MYKSLFIFFLLAMAPYSAYAGPGIDKSCMIKSCPAGTVATTYASKSEPYFACPTSQLADYTNMVLEATAFAAMVGGQLPNISEATGEPEFPDQDGKPNQTRLILEALRHNASVSTFDEAAEKCGKGRTREKVMVLNNSPDHASIWVHDAKRNRSFWMPKGMLIK